MRDTIIKGTGNSRSIKAAATIPATWEAFRAQLISSGIPVDLTGPNAAGCDVVGTALNKANLLKDATAALYGLGTGAVPDEVFALGLIGAVTGSYTGTGNQSQKITVGFTPSIVIVSGSGTYVDVSTKAHNYYFAIAAKDYPAYFDNYGNVMLQITENGFYVYSRTSAGRTTHLNDATGYDKSHGYIAFR